MEVLWSLILVMILLFLYVVLLWRIRSKERLSDYYRIPSYLPRILLWSQADQRINNISSSVPGQNPPHYPDAYLSVEHIMVANELNKSPKYNEAPPSYAEAMKLAMAHSNSLQTYQAEQEQSGQQLEATTATTSTTPIAATHQPPAVPNERF